MRRSINAAAVNPRCPANLVEAGASPLKLAEVPPTRIPIAQGGGTDCAAALDAPTTPYRTRVTPKGVIRIAAIYAVGVLRG